MSHSTNILKIEDFVKFEQFEKLKNLEQQKKDINIIEFKEKKKFKKKPFRKKKFYKKAR